MVIFRNLTKGDIEQVAAIENRVFPDAWTIQGLYETYENEHAFIVVAEATGEVLGYTIVYYVMEEGEIARIAVDEKLRRQGVGRGLLNYVSECCKSKNVKRLLLDVRKSNVGARAFYEQYGFAVDGIRKNYYEQPREDAVLMSKDLL